MLQRFIFRKEISAKYHTIIIFTQNKFNRENEMQKSALKRRLITINVEIIIIYFSYIQYHSEIVIVFNNVLVNNVS